jgi:hypothetical protein
MNDITRHLRAQIPSSTDPGRLERMAREAEGRTTQYQNPTRAHPGLVGTGTGGPGRSAGALGTSRSKSRRMRDGLVVIAACAGLIACTPPDTAHWPIFLPPPYSTWPPAPPGTPIEPGRPVGLNGDQQGAVVTSVLKWMKDPASAQFRGLEAVQNSRGRIIVCGEVTGRNSAGNASISPFIGVLMGADVDADFVLVGIGSSDHERGEVTSLCRANGIYGIQ